MHLGAEAGQLAPLRVDQDWQRSGHRAAFPKLHRSTSCLQVILSIVLLLLPAATRLFLSHDQTTANPYSFCTELFPLSFVYWEMLLKETLREYGNKARYSPRQTESFLQTQQETAKTRYTAVGKACNRKGRKHGNNTTFGQCSINILKLRIKAVLGETPLAVSCLTLCRIGRGDLVAD